MLILEQKSCFLGPTIFEIPQPNLYYSALNTIIHFTDAKYLSILNLLLFDSLPFKVQMFVL